MRRLVACVLLFALSWVPMAYADPPQPECTHGHVECLVIKYWPGNDEQALAVTRCETGGTMDPHARSSNGLYYGLWQQGTHQADHYSNHGDTWENGWHDAGKSTVVAWDILQSEGWGAWPYCARRYR